MNAFPSPNKRYNRKDHGKGATFFLASLLAILWVWLGYSCAHHEPQPAFQDYHEVLPRHIQPEDGP